jgi:signal transduction protein with GAF and PtsI domain
VFSRDGRYCHDLYNLVSTLNSSRSPANVIKSIVEGVAKAMNAKGCSLMLLTPDRKILLHTAAYGLSDWFVRKGPVKVDKSMEYTLQGNALAVLDATADERVQFRQQLRQEGIASVLSVPVTLRDEVIGVMRIYTAVPYEFTEADILFARMAASFGAIALEAAHFYHTLQKDYEEFRKDMLHWRAELGDEWLIEPSVEPVKDIPVKIPFGG